MEDFSRLLCRAERIDTREIVYGFLLIDYMTGQHFIHAVGNSVNESDKAGESGCLRFDAFEVVPSTVCQFTGLSDKKGKRIWENDIVIRDIIGGKITGTVVWRNIGHTGFFLEVSDGKKRSFYPMGCGMNDDDENENCNDIVIGNEDESENCF